MQYACLIARVPLWQISDVCTFRSRTANPDSQQQVSALKTCLVCPSSKRLDFFSLASFLLVVFLLVPHS